MEKIKRPKFECDAPKGKDYDMIFAENPNGPKIIKIDVLLDFQGSKKMLRNKNLPIIFEDNDPQTSNILIKPIIKFAIDLGMNLQGKQISYISMADEYDCPVGIEGQIDDQETVSIDDLKTG